MTETPWNTETPQGFAEACKWIDMLRAEVDHLRGLSSCKLCIKGLCSAHQPMAGQRDALSSRISDAMRILDVELSQAEQDEHRCESARLLAVVLRTIRSALTGGV